MSTEIDEQNATDTLREAAQQMRLRAGDELTAPVALAVADWLDATAVTMQRIGEELEGLEGVPTVTQVYGYDFTAALAVAHAALLAPEPAP